MVSQRATAPRVLVALLGPVLAALALLAPAAGAAPPRQEPAPSATTSPPQLAITTTPTPQPVSLAISKTLLGSDLVKVGQFLSFSIQITNTGATFVTELPLVDEYDQALLQPAPARAVPPPSSSAPGVMRWDDLTDSFGDLAPGQSVTVNVVFRAIRIEDEVINRARVETSLGTGGGGSGPAEDQAGGTVEGGSVRVEKALVEGFVNLDTPVISFTVSLTNEGFADIVRAPLVDTYNTALLSFLDASVPPDLHNPATGELRWNDLLAALGVARLRPGQSVSFSTTYRVIGSSEEAVVNSANAVDVADEFGNQVASPRQAEVRIRIGGDEATTPPPEEERRPRPSATPTATAAPSLTATPTAAQTAEATPTVAAAPSAGPAGGAPAPETPASLPATGRSGPPSPAWLAPLLALAAMLALGGALARRGR